MKFRESIRQRKQMKLELAELEKRKRDIFWDVEYAMLSTGIKYFNTCSEYWLYKVESGISRLKSLLKSHRNKTFAKYRKHCCKSILIFSEIRSKFAVAIPQ